MADEKPERGPVPVSAAAHGGNSHGGGHEEAHEGAPEWLISFADNVMLQMGFFVILLGLALQTQPGMRSGGSGAGQPGPSPEQLDWALAVREAFNNPVDPESVDPRDVLLVRRLAERRGLASADSPGRRGADHAVRSIRPSDYVGLGGTVPFARDSGALDDEGRAALAELLTHLVGHRNVLELRGHVSAAEAFGKPDRGMTLSYDRAHAVAEALAAGGVGWERMRLIGSADNDRVARGDYGEQVNRENQRVEIIVTNQVPPDG
jgi:outer membrane protein OmpA-like peptidoglycan-associated protein